MAGCRSDRPTALEVRARSFQPFTMLLVPSEDRIIQVRLVPIGRPAAGPPDAGASATGRDADAATVEREDA